MEEIFEIIPSQKGRYEINVRGYLLTKEKHRGYVYYWCCDKRRSENCQGRATTTFCDGKHILKNFVFHSHAPQTSSAAIANVLNQMKENVKQNQDLPCQIFQKTLVTINSENAPYMPSKNALRKRIAYVRKTERPPEPQSLEDLIIPEAFRRTLNNKLFLVRDSTVAQERIILYTTKLNVHRLSCAPYWLMDGTFKTVPNIFFQLYTIHAQVGGDNYRILPLVYALMTSKR